MLAIKKSDARGFTLIEILVAIGIFALISAGMVEIYLYSTKSNAIVWEQLSTQNEGRKVVQDFVNELRTASYSSIGAYPIESANTTSIVFYSDIDHDTFRERIRYFMSGAILKKGIIKPTGTPLSYNPASETISDVVHDIVNLGNPVFTYYDQNYTGVSGSPMPSPVNITGIRTVGISLRMEENPTASPAPFFIESKVEVRNLKSN